MPIPSFWKTVDNKLVREFGFATFMDAIDFIDRVAAIADGMHHHPEIWNSYDQVRLTLSTHDAGDMVTDRDRELATEIDKLI